MIGRSRKKVEVDKKKNKGEQVALPSFSLNKNKENDKETNVNQDSNSNNKNEETNEIAKKKDKLSKDTSSIDDLVIKDNKILNTKKKKVKPFIKILLIILAIALLIASLLLIIRFVNFNVSNMVWKVSLTRGSDKVNNKSIRYCSFNNGLMRISNDGITYIKANKEIRFTVSYNIKDPIYESRGTYFAIADRNANNFYIFDEKGLIGENTTTNAIQKISLSESGKLLVLQSDGDKSYINAFNSKGEITNLSVEKELTTVGMPIDISISQDGFEFGTADICLLDKEIFSKATYYDISNSVSSNANIIGEVKDGLEEKFLVRINYFSNNNSCLIYDGGVFFVSNNRKIIEHIKYDQMIKSIAYNRNTLAIILENNKMYIYTDSGFCMREVNVDFLYDKFYIDDNYIIFICEKRVIIYDTAGIKIFDKELMMDVQYVAKKKNPLFTELLVGLIDGVECIRFY